MTQLHNNRKTDLAWEHLVRRLTQDGLLPVNKEAGFRMTTYKWVAVLALLLASVATVRFVHTLPAGGGPEQLTISNKAGAATLVTTFEDGTIVYLAGGAQLRYPAHFDVAKREVHLTGDAFFDVSPNASRPFVLETEYARIKVIGTSFHVRNTDHVPFDLAVREGKVHVTDKDSHSEATVEAGKTASLLESRLSVNLTADTHRFDLLTGRIQFKDEKLGNIIRAINRRADKDCLAIAPSLNERLLTVTFSGNSPEMMAKLICLALNLTYTQEMDMFVLAEP